MSSDVAPKKQNFLQGAGILAISVAVVKVISALYKIPLNNVIGSEGYAYFLQTYSIYSLLLIISTAGLPVAVSRMIAEAKDPARVNRINRASLILFTGLGLVGTLIMMVLAKPLAAAMGVPDCSITFVALGPAVLFVCVNSAFRGYFQGHSNMTPTALSQVIEALFKLLLGLLLAFLIQKISGILINSVAGAILGVTVGSVFAFVYLALEYYRSGSEERKFGFGEDPEPISAAIKELLAIAVPITIGSAGLQLFDLIDSAMIMHRLRDAANMSYDAAKNLRGLYGTAQTMFGLPSAFVTPFTATLIPAIANALKDKNRKAAEKVTDDELRIMSMIIMPCGVGLCVLGTPIIQLLYPRYDETDCAVAGTLLSIIAVAVILNALVLLMNTVLQGYNYVSLPIITMIAGGLVKVIVNFILVGIPAVNIYGAPIGTILCFITIAGLDYFCLQRLLKHPPKILKLMKKTILACAVMGVAAWGSNALLAQFLSVKIACAGAIVIAVAVYAAMIFLLKMISYEDCLMLPKGKKIAALLRIAPTANAESE